MPISKLLAMTPTSALCRLNRRSKVVKTLTYKREMQIELLRGNTDCFLSSSYALLMHKFPQVSLTAKNLQIKDTQITAQLQLTSKFKQSPAGRS